eukprot:jgi/Mesvir1/27163/Mv20827-RA.1
MAARVAPFRIFQGLAASAMLSRSHLWIAGAGAVALASSASMTTEAKQEDAPKPATAFNPSEWKQFKLEKVYHLTHNTRLMRFDAGGKDLTSGMTVASCVVTRYQNGTKEDGSPNYVIRPYTPTSTPDTKGYFDLVIKVYPEGKMSKHLGEMKEGDVLEVKGPVPKLKYEANMKKHIGMIAGGTGITPMLQVIHEVVNNPADKTKLTLLFANVTEDDIILRSQLEAMAKKHPNLTVLYTLEKPPAGWKGYTGRVSKDMISQLMPPPSDDAMVLVCGPDPMLDAICGGKDKKTYSQGPVGGFLKELNYESQHIYKF